MKIKKIYQGTVPENKIVNTYSASQTDVYSCNYINEFNINYIDNEEIKTNELFNSKTVYCKQINLPNLPNCDEQSYDDGLDHKKILIIKAEGFATDNTGAYQNSLNGLDTRISVNPNGLTLKTSENYSSYTAYIRIYYVYK